MTPGWGPPHAYLYNLDDLKRVVDRNLRARAGEIPKVEALIEKALGDYMEWYAGHRVQEAIRALGPGPGSRRPRPSRRPGLWSWKRRRGVWPTPSSWG